jgi:sulfotransferase
MPELHFLAGLPRSGSTLLMNILAQNPAIYPTTTSPLLESLVRARNSWQEISTYNARPVPLCRQGAMRGFLNGFYAHLVHHQQYQVVLDKNRVWPSHLELVEELLGRSAKVICPVRSLVDIMASFEKLFRREKIVRRPDSEGQIVGQFLSVQGRTNFWSSEVGVVGSVVLMLKDAKLRGYRDRLHFVEYSDLTKFPAKTLKKIYEFLDMEPYAHHDFEHVEQAVSEDDAWHGYEDLHTIRPKVETQISDAISVLGPELASAYSQVGVNFWRDPAF